MGINYLSEKPDSIRNEMSHIWGGIFIVGGGTVTIVLTGMNFIKTALFIFGIILTLLLLNAYIIRKTEVSDVLKQLHKEDL
jgi:hypothetical protein